MWLALKLVSLHYQIQQRFEWVRYLQVVISFKISIFALSNTTLAAYCQTLVLLWLALKLVSLHYQIQQEAGEKPLLTVVISFKISIFALSNTTVGGIGLGILRCD